MNTRFRTAWIVTALAVSLAGCSKTGEHTTADPSAATGSTPGSDAAPAKADFPLSQKPPSVTISAGTPLKIRTETTLSTKSAQTGDTFTATLAEPIMIEGKVVAPRGSQVEGRVVDSDPGGRVKGVATISVRLTQLRVGDRKVAIETGTIARGAKATKRNDAVKVGIGAGIGAAIGAIAGGGQGAAIGAASGGAAGTGVVLATHGEPAVIGAESVLTFKLTAPVTVEPS
jgi:hypothetical protein